MRRALPDPWRALGVWPTLVILLSASPLWADDAESKSDFASVQKIFAAKCVRCHGADARKAELDLTSKTALAKGGESGEILDADSPDDSLLLRYVVDGDMPPEGEGELTADEVETISDWVRQVAKGGGLRVARAVDQHDVLPLLQLRCSVCHGLRKQEGELDVRTKASLLKGGKSGPAIVLGAPEKSLLLKRIHKGDMPPRRLLIKVAVKPMAPHEIELLTGWIRNGAPERQVAPDVMTVESDPLVTDEDRRFWAFQPPRAAASPTIRNRRQARTPIDAFILRRLEEVGLRLSPEADRRALIRRASFDLLGLPPTPAEVDAFVRDDRPAAFERMLDRLLASPRYGERWGQHWLDLAGYSDSEGVQHADRIRPFAYRYRDYVIRSLNADKPYDRFITEQLAGDELADYEQGPLTDEVFDNLVATGFLRMAPDATYTKLTGFVPDRLELIDDELEILSSAILGLTIKCARCHSHKFDPIPQRDYYRLAAVFKGALDEHDWLTPDDRWLPHVKAAETDRWKKSGGKPENQPKIRALWDRGEPTDTYILKRGNYLTLGRLVGPGVPSVLTDGKTPFDVRPPWPGAKKSGRRLAFARWLTQKDHPLTARVIVNRVWKQHFGRGIVRTLDNFGKAGARPSHPELLDWLAVRFMEDGWSLKALHRRIMTSAVYRQSSQVAADHMTRDPDNVLLSRMPLVRMEGEVVRDALLSIADRLDFTSFGPADSVTARGDGLITSNPFRGNDAWRRSVYVIKRRTQPVTILQDFDVGRMDPNCVERSESIVAPQALHLKNNRWVRQLSDAFSERIWREAGGDAAAQIRLAYRLVAGRAPSAKERATSRAALEQLRGEWRDRDPGAEQRLTAVKHLWIRETEPERVFEDDLVSVWSSKSSDKGRRWGLLEFDVRGLADLDVTGAKLRLGVMNESAIQQQAWLIPAGIDGLQWARYQAEKAKHETPLEGLGRLAVKAKALPVGSYTVCNGATKADLARIRERITSGGRVTIVLKADEDGSDYRQDWDDGVYKSSRKNPPQLVIYDSRPNPSFAQRKALDDFCHALINTAAFLYID